MNIGIIGSGNIGGILAARLVKLGHIVYVANSRGPETLEEFANETGAIPVTVRDAANSGEIVIVTIPVKNIPELPEDLFKDVPERVIVIDTGNYYPNLRDGIMPELEEDITESEWLKNKIGRPVIKTFNSISSNSLKELHAYKGKNGRIAIPVSGDDVQDKQVVMQLVDELGFDPVDGGKLSESWKQQPGTSIYCQDQNLEQHIFYFNTVAPVRTAEIRKSIEENREAQVAAYLKSLQKEE